MAQDTCRKCGKPVTRDEKGLTKKFINRGMETYFCMECLAEHIGVSVRLLEEKVKQFREMGCVLFK
ncbi:MAG: hypothetical protein E7326_04830 [Clostridiales bacterium]|nr:hypothetical protein [Clostridiales bacterium]